MHHVGYVVRSIDLAMPGFQRSLNGSWNGTVFTDPIQRVKVAFLSTPGCEVQIELVEPSEAHSPVEAFLQRGGGLHHLCYEVDDCEASLQLVRQRRGLIVKRPSPAVAFDGRRIAWAMTAEKLLLEFVESAKGGFLHKE